MAAPSGPWLPTAVTVTASWLAGVPTVILSPTAKPSARRTLIRVAPALAGAERLVRPAAVPTCATVTVSIPWPTLSISSRILSPMEISEREVTLMLVAPAGASIASQACVPGLPTAVTVAISYCSTGLAATG